MIQRLIREQFVAGEPEKIWAFFAAPGNLDVLTPESFSFKIINNVAESMYPGQMIEYRIGLLPGITTRWLTEITHVREGEFFVDEQRVGPYRLWHHEHHFQSVAGIVGLQMKDIVTYEVGWGPISAALHALWIRRQLEQIFDFRARKIKELFPEIGPARRIGFSATRIAS